MQTFTEKSEKEKKAQRRIEKYGGGRGYGGHRSFDDTDMPVSPHIDFAPSDVSSFQADAPYRTSSPTYLDHMWRNRSPETLERYGDIQSHYQTKAGYDRYVKNCKRTEGMKKIRPEQYYEEQKQALKAHYGDAEQQVKTFLESAFKNGTFCMRCSLDTLGLILESGRIKNQHETHTSEGALDSDQRKHFEIEKLGARQKTLPENLPKYGYWGPKDETVECRNAKLDQYGNVIIKFKAENVKKRCTFTLGDSMDEGGNCLPAKVMDPNLGAVAWENKVNLIQEARRFQREKDNDNNLQANMYDAIPHDNRGFHSYLEIQYHGELTVDDIESITIKSAANEQPRGVVHIHLPEGVEELVNTACQELGIPMNSMTKIHLDRYLGFQNILDKAKEKNIPVKILNEQIEMGDGKKIKVPHLQELSELSPEFMRNVIVKKVNYKKDQATVDQDYKVMRKLELRVKAEQLGLSKAYINQKLRSLSLELGIKEFNDKYKKIFDQMIRKQDITQIKKKEKIDQQDIKKKIAELKSKWFVWNRKGKIAKLEKLLEENKTKATEALEENKRKAEDSELLNALLLPDVEPMLRKNNQKKQVMKKEEDDNARFRSLPNRLQRLFRDLPVKVQNYYMLGASKERAKNNVDSRLLLREVQKEPEYNEHEAKKHEKGVDIVNHAVLSLIAKGYDVEHFWKESKEVSIAGERFDTCEEAKNKPVEDNGKKRKSDAKEDNLAERIQAYRHSNIYAVICKLRELPPGDPDSIRESIARGASHFGRAVRAFFRNEFSFLHSGRQRRRREEFTDHVLNPYLRKKQKRRVSTKEEFYNALRKMDKDEFLEPRDRDALNAYLMMERRAGCEVEDSLGLAGVKQLRGELWERVMTLAGLKSDGTEDRPSNDIYGLKGAYADVTNVENAKNREHAKFLHAKAVATVDMYQYTDIMFQAAGVDYNKLFTARNREQFKRILLRDL